MHMKFIKTKIALLLVLLISVLAACGGNDDGGEKTTSGGKAEVKIGYFPNLTHIATIIGLEKGYFKEAFGKDVKIETKVVNNGGLFMEAMVTKAIDVGTVGPGPVINFYIKDPKYHIISGAVNGGAVLVSSKDSGIKELKDLAGKKVAIPVIGSTQDIMLRKALNDVGLKPTSNGGDVELKPAAPADTTTLFTQGSIDAAATQEPWGYILETQAGGKTLLGWNEFAWGKDSTNTVVAASDAFLKNEDDVKAYLTAHDQAVEFIKENPDESKKLIIKHIKDLTGKEIDAKEVDAAFEHLLVTTDVNEKVIQEMADISKEADYVPGNDIDGLVELKYLKAVQKDRK